MKISFAMITRHFNSLEPIEEFLDNAHKYGHKIYSVIIVYSHSCDVKLVEILRKSKGFTVQINNVHKVREQLRQMGMHHEDIDILLDYPDFRKI